MSRRRASLRHFVSFGAGGLLLAALACDSDVVDPSGDDDPLDVLPTDLALTVALQGQGGSQYGMAVASSSSRPPGRTSSDFAFGSRAGRPSTTSPES